MRAGMLTDSCGRVIPPAGINPTVAKGERIYPNPSSPPNTFSADPISGRQNHTQPNAT